MKLYLKNKISNNKLDKIYKKLYKKANNGETDIIGYLYGNPIFQIGKYQLIYCYETYKLIKCKKSGVYEVIVGTTTSIPTLLSELYISLNNERTN